MTNLTNNEPIPDIADTEVHERSSRTPLELRQITLELLKFGFIELNEKQELYQLALLNRKNIENILEPLDIDLSIDEQRGLMILFVRVDDGDEEERIDEAWSHPLIRRQRFTLEQSLLIAILRQHYVVQEMELGTGMEAIKMPMDILIDQMFKYLPDSGSDSKNERRIYSMVEKLKTHGLLTEPDKNQDITIRPLICHLQDPENLKAVLKQFQTHSVS